MEIQAFSSRWVGASSSAVEVLFKVLFKDLRFRRRLSSMFESMPVMRAAMPVMHAAMPVIYAGMPVPVSTWATLLYLWVEPLNYRHSDNHNITIFDATRLVLAWVARGRQGLPGVADRVQELICILREGVRIDGKRVICDVVTVIRHFPPQKRSVFPKNDLRIISRLRNPTAMSPCGTRK